MVLSAIPHITATQLGKTHSLDAISEEVMRKTRNR